MMVKLLYGEKFLCLQSNTHGRGVYAVIVVMHFSQGKKNTRNVQTYPQALMRAEEE